MKALLKLGIVVLAGYVAWNYFFPKGTGVRAALFMTNGPVRIEAQANNRGRGEFRKGMFGAGRSWYHHHPGQAPSTMEVTVTDSSCGSDATYQVTEFTVLSAGSAGSSSVRISIWSIGPASFVQIDPFTGTKIDRDPMQQHQLNVGERDDQMQTVRIAGSSCAFTGGSGTITIVQKP
jgi:hypothetical protein